MSKPTKIERIYLDIVNKERMDLLVTSLVLSKIGVFIIIPLGEKIYFNDFLQFAVA